MTDETRTASDSDDLADGSVDKIRDIIFGRTMRDYERRFSQLEQRIAEDNRRLSSDLSARFEQLEAHMKQEFQAHTERLATERRERIDALDEQRGGLAEASRLLTEKIADVDESLASAAQQIRGQLHEQAAEQIEQLGRARSELLDSLRREAHRLGEEKLARSELAALLQTLALDVSGEGDGGVS
ncbi:MAG: hypothetical protein AAF610_11065 [Pseudomonadota bacterium]